MSSPPPPDQADPAHQAPPTAASAPQPEQRSRNGFDYALVAVTSVLFLFYFPVFGGVPRMLLHRLTELDLMWFLPLLLVLSCTLMFWSWLLRGATIVGRLVWMLLLVLAVLGYPAAIIAVSMLSPAAPDNYFGAPLMEAAPVPVEPAKPQPPSTAP